MPKHGPLESGFPHLPAWVLSITLNLWLTVLKIKQLILYPFRISAVQCKAIRALPLPLSMNCSHPLRNFSFGSRCLFACKEGFSLNGTEMLVCSSAGFWSDRLPVCLGKLLTENFLYTACTYKHRLNLTKMLTEVHFLAEGMPVGTALLMYTGVGAAVVGVPLALIGLCLLIITRVKKRGEAYRVRAAWCRSHSLRNHNDSFWSLQETQPCLRHPDGEKETIQHLNFDFSFLTDMTAQGFVVFMLAK